jgi:PqqD family protein of HPr-rel-A system
MQWRITAPGQVYDAGEDSIVYFDPRSGDTHLLGAFAAFIIDQLQTEALDLAALTERSVPLAESESPEKLRESISIVIDELEALEILERL